MKDDIRQCVAARVDFFSTYYTVPEAVQPKVQDFCDRVTRLGEESADAAAFEAAFAARGLQEEFMALLPLCTPKAVPVSQEYQDYSRQVANQMRKEQHIGKKVVEDIVDSAMVEADEALIAARRKGMIETGVYDEYTRATNAVDDIGILGGFLKRKFGKKKG